MRRTVPSKDPLSPPGLSGFPCFSVTGFCVPQGLCRVPSEGRERERGTSKEYRREGKGKKREGGREVGLS